MKKIALILFVILGIACAKEERDYIPVEQLDLDNCEEIACREVAMDNYLLSYPTAMFFADGHLIIKDEKGHQKLFHVLESDGKLVQEFLEQGGGPEEYALSSFNAQLSDNHILEMYDASQRKILSFESKEGHFCFSSAFSLKNRDENIREMINCGDFYLAMGVNGLFDDYRFLVLDTLGNVKKATGTYPAIQPDLFAKPEEDLQTLLFHTPFFRVSPDRKKAVFASYKGALIQFFDLSSLPDSVATKSILLERPKKKEQITREHEGWVYGFEDVYATNDCVYAIYNGETAVENPELGRCILRYDWNGNLLNRYRTDKGLRCLAVDEGSGTVFLVSYVDDEMKFFSGNLPRNDQ